MVSGVQELEVSSLRARSPPWSLPFLYGSATTTTRGRWVRVLDHKDSTLTSTPESTTGDSVCPPRVKEWIVLYMYPLGVSGRRTGSTVLLRLGSEIFVVHLLPSLRGVIGLGMDRGPVDGLPREVPTGWIPDSLVETDIRLRVSRFLLRSS